MSLVTYEDTQADAPSDPSRPVYELIGVRIRDAENQMPPTGVMLAPEIKTLETWIAADAPPGASGCSEPILSAGPARPVR